MAATYDDRKRYYAKDAITKNATEGPSSESLP